MMQRFARFISPAVPLFLLVVFVFSYIAFGPARPASATTGLGKICFNFTNGNGLKTVRECAMVDQHVYPSGSGMHEGYGEFTFANTQSTHAAAVKLTYNAVFSRVSPSGAWCDGSTTVGTCSGVGDWPSNWVFGIDGNTADYHTADTITTHCQVYFVMDTQIQWTAGNAWYDMPSVASLIVNMTTPCGP